MDWRRFIKMPAVLLLVFFISCGGGSDEDNTDSNPDFAPPLTDPSIPPNNDDGSFTPADPESDSRVPDLSRAVELLLQDPVALSGLADLAQVVVPPLVGSALISMDLFITRNSGISGNTTIAFEDGLGLWGARLRSFLGNYDGSQFDMILADDEFVLRIVALNSNDVFTGEVYYRLRQPGDNACRPVIVTCNPVGPPTFNFIPFGQSPPANNACQGQIDVETPCLAYMNLSDSSVRNLGAFSTTFSNWVGTNTDTR